jgi:hypothetical protein
VSVEILILFYLAIPFWLAILAFRLRWLKWKVKERAIWCKRFLGKAKCFGFKDLLLGKSSIPKVDEEIDETSDIGKKKSMIIESNEIAYTELILLIDVKANSYNFDFTIIRGWNIEDYQDGNGSIVCERLKNKYEPVSASSMVRLEKQFRELSLKKGQNPKIWITELEDLCIKLENMDSCITENQFMIHILNNITSDYDLQIELMERRVGEADEPLTVEEVRGESNLKFETLNMIQEMRKVKF